jgi:hypothetical protein
MTVIADKETYVDAQIKQRDQLSGSLYFRSPSIQINRDPIVSNEISDAIYKILGHRLNTPQITLLFGTPATADVRASVSALDPNSLAVYWNYETTIELPNGERVEMEAKRVLKQDRHSREPIIYNENLEISDLLSCGQGIGARVFAAEVYSASAAGIKEIIVPASRDYGRVGYFVWMKLGVNWALSAALQEKAWEDGLGRVDSTNDIASLGEVGEQWWKQFGEGANGKFDLATSSESFKILDRYIERKGIHRELLQYANGS